jgi:hypothetical protein
MNNYNENKLKISQEYPMFSVDVMDERSFLISEKGMQPKDVTAIKIFYSLLRHMEYKMYHLPGPKVIYQILSEFLPHEIMPPPTTEIELAKLKSEFSKDRIYTGRRRYERYYPKIKEDILDAFSKISKETNLHPLQISSQKVFHYAIQNYDYPENNPPTKGTFMRLIYRMKKNPKYSSHFYF